MIEAEQERIQKVAKLSYKIALMQFGMQYGEHLEFY